MASILKNCLINDYPFGLHGGGKINRKTLAVSLAALAVLSVVGGLITMTAIADTNSTNTDTTDTSTVLDSTIPQFGDNMQMMAGTKGFGGGPSGRGHGMGSMSSGMSNIEVSDEYKANVNTILSSDVDVANLISEDYNVTSIKPVIKNVIEGDGTLVTKATTVIVIMENGDSGVATVEVDVEISAVTKITIVTTTVIDKSSS